jgi:hypothetical protein
MTPRAALVSLAATLEDELNALISDLWPGSPHVSIRTAIQLLLPLELVPQELDQAVEQFMSVRSRLVHTGEVDEDSFVRALDLGLRIQSAIKSIAHIYVVVQHPPVTLYRDENCEHARSDIWGLIVKVVNYGQELTPGITATFAVRSQDYRSGQRLSWRFAKDQSFEPAWYRHPETAAPTLAWQVMELGTFIGRDLDD